MPYAPAAVIDAPPRLPLPYGLFSVVSFAEAATERWENGIEWEAIACASQVSVVVGDCNDASSEGFPKQFPDTCAVGSAAAFTVYGSYKSSPNGSDYETKAREILLAREEQAVETRFWKQIDDSLSLIV